MPIQWSRRYATVAVLSILLTQDALLRSAISEEAGRAKASISRRSPVVEIFDEWSSSIVFVTGPIHKQTDPPLDKFFTRPGRTKQENSIGTGFVLHESGYILTNAHATDRLVSHRVVMSDGKAYPADVIASVRESDLALLKVAADKPLKPVRLAPSNEALIGETVILIAHPHGLRNSCTTGVVSAMDRTSNLLDQGGLTLRNLIQTDAGINPGSSGGPWFNIEGQVFGITTSMKRDAENIGFAIPVATIRQHLPDMLDIQRRYGITSGINFAAGDSGRVSHVEPNSPASTADIQIDDLLVRVDGQPTPTEADFHLALIGRKPGDTLALEFTRRDRSISTTLVLGEHPKPDGAALLKAKFGLTAVPLDAARAKAMSLRVPRGILISDVDTELYAKIEHKPAPGDVLAQLGDVRPRDLDHLGLLLEAITPGKKVSLVLVRHKDSVATRVDLSIVVPE